VQNLVKFGPAFPDGKYSDRYTDLFCTQRFTERVFLLLKLLFLFHFIFKLILSKLQEIELCSKKDKQYNLNLIVSLNSWFQDQGGIGLVVGKHILTP